MKGKLDTSPIAGRMFCLHQDTHRSRSFVHEAQELRQRDDLMLLVPSGRTGEVEFLQLGQSQVRDRARTVTGAVDGAIVMAHEVTVPREPDIAFDGIGTKLDGTDIGREALLG